MFGHKKDSDTGDVEHQAEIGALVTNLFLLSQKFKPDRKISGWFKGLDKFFPGVLAATSNDSLLTLLLAIGKSLDKYESSKVTSEIDVANVLAVFEGFLGQSAPVSFDEEEVTIIKSIITRLAYLVAYATTINDMKYNESLIIKYAELVKIIHEVVITRISNDYIKLGEDVNNQMSYISRIKDALQIESAERTKLQKDLELLKVEKGGK